MFPLKLFIGVGMASTFFGIEMGKRSLMAHNQSIMTAGHNISNADNEGYSRQRVNLRAFDPLYRPDLEREERPGQVGQRSGRYCRAR